MEIVDREATFAAIEAEFRTQQLGYVFREAEEFARFDLRATYVGGDDALTVRRCSEHLADLYDAACELPPRPDDQADGARSKAALRVFFRHLYA